LGDVVGFQQFIKADGSTQKILCEGSGDKSNWSSTSSEDEALGDTARELRRGRRGRLEIPKFLRNFTFLGLEGDDAFGGRDGRAAGTVVGSATSKNRDAWGARDVEFKFSE
jgi:hypothetical protein